MARHIIDTPPLRSGERVRAFLKIARKDLSYPERRAIFRQAGREVSPQRMKRFLRIERGRVT
ncbi:MAG: hypothetical protein AAGH83_09010 [Pseudomonadota bacterium]